MTVTKFIKKKNKILKKYTGIKLVPEDQIKEVPKSILNMGDDMNACPYCAYFKYEKRENGMHGCEECPMHQANNGCLYALEGQEKNHKKSTYEQVTKKARVRTIVAPLNPWYSKLKNLIDTYNEELHNELKD